MKRVEITWLDAHIVDGLIDMEQVNKLGPVVTYSVGSLLRWDEGGIALCMDTYPEEGDRRWANVNFIPHCMIEKVVYL